MLNTNYDIKQNILNNKLHFVINDASVSYLYILEKIITIANMDKCECIQIRMTKNHN